MGDVGLYKSWREVPGPRPFPIVGRRGNILKLMLNPVDHLMQAYRRFGGLSSFVLGRGRPLFYNSEECLGTFFALGSESLRELTEQSNKLENREPPGSTSPSLRRLATNIFFTNGDRHRNLRRILTPSLSRSMFQDYYKSIVSITRERLDTWDQGDVLNLDSAVNELILFISSKIFYGCDVNPSRRSLAHMMGDMVSLLFSPAAMIPIDLPYFPYRRLLRVAEAIERELESEIAKKLEVGCVEPDVLSALVKLNKEDPDQLTADELVGSAFTTFFAGHDTTAKALTWMLFLLAQHPEVAAALFEELDRELGGEPPPIEKVMDLPVLDRVVKESLRILGPAVFFSREVISPVVINGYELPAKSEVIYSPYVVHHDPAVYPIPSRFDPDRWLTISPNKYEYLPFGVGPRTCLGGNFSSFQLRIIVAMICQRYRLSIVPGSRIDLKTTVVIGPKPALPVRVHRQDREFQRSPAAVRGYINQMVDLPK